MEIVIAIALQLQAVDSKSSEVTLQERLFLRKDVKGRKIKFNL